MATPPMVVPTRTLRLVHMSVEIWKAWLVSIELKCNGGKIECNNGVGVLYHYTNKKCYCCNLCGDLIKHCTAQCQNGAVLLADTFLLAMLINCTGIEHRPQIYYCQSIW